MSPISRNPLHEYIARSRKESYAEQFARDEFSQPLSYYEESAGEVLVIRGKQYLILKSHIQKYPLLIGGEVHGAAAHTLVHFLYTGTYETIASPLEGDLSFKEREFQRSVYVYQASRSCNIPDLTKLAKGHIGECSRGVSVLEILRWTAQIFPMLPSDEIWLQAFVGAVLRRSAQLGDLKFGVDDPSRILDKNQSFRKALSDYLLDHLHSTTESLELLDSEGICELPKNPHPHSQQRPITSKKRPAPE